MAKIIDSFLFFQELDLLEIRLRHLYDHVDHFVIIEASQAFSGKPKPFVFEASAERFAAYADKITYFKLAERHANLESVRGVLQAKADPISAHILDILDNQSHFDPNDLHWVLDQYHREALFYPLAQIADPDDLVFFSDLDEIPSHAGLADAARDIRPDGFAVLVCDEFDYFVNWFNFRGWFGPIAGRWSNIQGQSLNALRRQVRNDFAGFAGTQISRGGYHFTSCGGVEAVERKIESWGHQEFNVLLVKARLKDNIRYGRDVFFRGGKPLTYVALDDEDYFEQTLAPILTGYPHLVAERPEKRSLLAALLYELDRVHFKLLRAFQKIASKQR